MKPDAKKLIEDAMQLEPPARALIAETLLESLDFEEDFKMSPAWREEIRRRCEEIDSGKVKLTDSDTVLTELRKTY